MLNARESKIVNRPEILNKYVGLPDENGRLQILNVHTAFIRQNNKLVDDVVLTKLNLAGERAEVAPEAADKFKIYRADFMHAVENDIKPAFGLGKEEFDSYVANGIIIWGPPVTEILDEGILRISHTIKSEMTPLVSILIEVVTQHWPHIALSSKFPYLKFCTAQTMLGGFKFSLR
ncbi:unnamed protein product [Didymodactylos carnosus]|uniref:Vesicle-fusing ATPase n=1 Tax=Didymodactylos carnosus TaxID=1234261 RepID=A0A8S2RKU6_9BILA|nr:unnamed protein product [Didymodactylos carnosus]CAF4156857.1 unnamed protein product [Didymodactylos carnosus]